MIWSGELKLNNTTMVVRLPVVFQIWVKNQQLKILDPCLAFFIIRTLVLMTKHMRHIEWFTGTFALLDLLIVAETSTILNPFLETTTEKMGQNEWV